MDYDAESGTAYSIYSIVLFVDTVMQKYHHNMAYITHRGMNLNYQAIFDVGAVRLLGNDTGAVSVVVQVDNAVCLLGNDTGAVSMVGR